MEIQTSYRLVEEARVGTSDGSAFIQGVRTALPLKGSAWQEIVERLVAGWMTEEELGQLVDLPVLYYALNTLKRHRLIRTRYSIGEAPLLTVSPAADKEPRLQHSKLRLSRFAYLRQDLGEVKLESPLTSCRVTIHDHQLANLALELCSSIERELSVEERLFAGVLSSIGMLDSADTCSDSLPVWEFHDLLFHSRTSDGFHAYPYGGTTRFKGRRSPQPVVKVWPETGDLVSLPPPSEDLGRKLQAPFVEVLNRRQSLREPGSRPINMCELGAFLYESARLKTMLNSPDFPCAASLRPFPSGGALHSLEVYFLVHRCEGLRQDVYHYDVQISGARPLSVAPPEQARLLACCPFPSMGCELPDLTFYISSRFERTAWKYESIAYHLVQQDLGCLYQTMYLVATALDLAPCALGVTQCALLAKILGIDPFSEPFVGAFTLSARP